MTLSIRDLTYRIFHRTLIEKITMEFKPGVLYGVLGPNGSGKSTLLKTMARIWTPTSGQLSWREKDLQTFSRHELSQTLSLVPQNPSLFFDFSVYNIVTMGCYAKGSRSIAAQKHIAESLIQVDGWHLRHHMMSELSGGEKQRIYIARALATQAPVLLLDEPTSYLDLRHQLEVWHLLKTLVAQGKLIIVAVHDLTAAQRFCDQLLILQEGRCQAVGSYEQVITPQLLQTVFGVQFNDSLGLYQLHTK